MSEVMVSVVCTAYNHEKYIRKCLDGFVMQKTNFLFEVFVHDDASTDSTADIIREYAQNYPEIIKPIYQKENQYSKGIGIVKTYIRPLLQGKYIAVCEGDDCWIDENKLQIQYDYMEEHPDCTLCVHNAIMHDVNAMSDSLHTKCFVERDYSADEIIRGGGGIFATNSAMFKPYVYLDRPSVFFCPGVEDYQLFIYAAMEGKVHYIPLVMSRYNSGVAGSWSERIWNNLGRRIEHFRNIIAMLSKVDAFYNYKHTNSITDVIHQTEFAIIELNDDKKAMRQKKYRKYYKKRKEERLRQKQQERRNRRLRNKRKLAQVLKQVKKRFPVASRIKHWINRQFNLPGEK